MAKQFLDNLVNEVLKDCHLMLYCIINLFKFFEHKSMVFPLEKKSKFYRLL